MDHKVDEADKGRGTAVEARPWRAQVLSLTNVILLVGVVFCEVLVLRFLPNGTEKFWTSRDMKAALAALVGLPVLLSFASLFFALLKDPERWRFKLWIPDKANEGEKDKEEEEDQEWANAVTFVSKSWLYERERFFRSMERIGPSSFLFGAIATLLLTSAVLVAAWGQQIVASPIADVFAVSLATAVGVAFLGQFVRILVRIAGQDFNARMFAWASRLLVLVAIADAGLFIVLHKVGTPQWIVTYGGAVLLGLFTAVLGDRAIDLMLSKTGGVFGVTAPKPAAPSSLSNIDGITDEDTERFTEERVLSIYDLAFAPTARLFFSTSHSLQRICDWQDQALLLAYMGPARAKALFEQLGIRGAIDLQALAVLVVPEDKTPEDEPPPADASVGQGAAAMAGGSPRAPVAGSAEASESSAASLAVSTGDAKGSGSAGNGGPSNLKSHYSGLERALGKAVGLEGAALKALLYTVNTDDVIFRLRVHWRGTAEVE